MSWRVFLNLTAATLFLVGCSMQRSAVGDLDAFHFFHCESKGLHGVSGGGYYVCR